VRLAEWFAGLWQRGGSTGHLRRLHYRMVTGAERAERHDGSPYENTKTCSSELDQAAKFARYLGLVDAEAITDRRNDPAIVNCPPREGEPEPYVTLTEDWQRKLAIPELTLPGELRLPRPWAYGYDYEHADQAALLEVWIEKSTMNDVLVPLCRNLGINLLVGKGHTSITRMIELLRRAEQAGRPAHILCICDFDPGGDSMPRSIARQAQFWRDRLGIDADLTVEHVALTRDQVSEFALPPIPIEDTRRASSFKDKHEVDGQVELDALEALHPGELARIVRAAAAGWIDESLEAELSSAENDADRAADEQWDDGDLQDELDEINDEITTILDRYETTVAQLNAELEPLRQRARALADQVEARFDETEFDLPERPEPDEPDVDRDGFLYDSGRHWLTQREYWQRHRDGES
jgi:hypothetical protein